MDEQTTRRNENVRVKLAPDMLERVERMARNYGMPTATLCAFAVAEWVAQKEHAQSLSRMAVADIGRKVGGEVEAMVGKLADGDQFNAILSQVTSALSQRNLPLDGDASPKGGG